MYILVFSWNFGNIIFEPLFNSGIVSDFFKDSVKSQFQSQGRFFHKVGTFVSQKQILVSDTFALDVYLKNF